MATSINNISGVISDDKKEEKTMKKIFVELTKHFGRVEANRRFQTAVEDAAWNIFEHSKEGEKSRRALMIVEKKAHENRFIESLLNCDENRKDLGAGFIFKSAKESAKVFINAFAKEKARAEKEKAIAFAKKKEEEIRMKNCKKTKAAFVAAITPKDEAKACRVLAAKNEGLNAFKAIANGHKYFSLQMFAAKKNIHLTDEKFVEAIKGHGENGYVQYLEVVPVKVGKQTIPVIKTHAGAVQITPLNEGFMTENIALYNAIGHKAIYKKGSNQFIIIDISAFALEDAENVKKCTRTLFNNPMYIVEGRDNKLHVLSSLGDSSGALFDMTHLKDNGSYKDYDLKNILTDKGNFKKSVRVFSGSEGCVLSSSSQTRGWQYTAFNATTDAARKRYIAALNDSTMGEASLVDKMGALPIKDAVDASVRISSKMTRMSLRKYKIGPVAITFTKDDNSDGNFTIASDAFMKAAILEQGVDLSKVAPTQIEKSAEKLAEGYLVQCRPFTIKGAALIMSRTLIDSELKKFNLLHINVDKAPKALLEAVQTVLNKAARKATGIREEDSQIPGVTTALVNLPKELEGYNGVILYHNGQKDDPVELIADLNAVKDFFDLKKRSGFNVMAMTHMDRHNFKKAKTSSQFNEKVLNAIVKCPDLKDAFDDYVHSIIQENMDEAVACKTASPEQLGNCLMDTSYIAGFVKQLNSYESLKDFPDVFKGFIENVQKTLEKDINQNAYKVYGHSGMIAVDPAYKIWGHSVLNVNKDIIEIFDPVFNRYAKKYSISRTIGIGIKYPSMGTEEFALLKFISEEEMIDRVRELGQDLDKEIIEIEAIVKNYSLFKEGGIFIPADLNRIAMILAGSDEDGDKLSVIFPTDHKYDFAGIMEEAVNRGAISMKPVKIQTSGGKESTIMVDSNIKTLPQEVFKAQVATGNKGVGTVTLFFELIRHGLLYSNPSATIKGFYIDMFKTMFGAGSLGSDEYKSQVNINVDSEGYAIHTTEFEIANKIAIAISKMAPSWDNVMKAMQDLDVCGRHVQELTIDAVKKFYKVPCDLMNVNSNNTYFKLLGLKYGIKFDMNWNAIDTNNSHIELIKTEGYKMDNNLNVTFEEVTHVEWGDKNDKTHMYVAADAFAPYRAFAATYAAQLLDGLRNEYAEAKEAYNNPFDTILLRQKKNAVEAFTELGHTMRLVRNADNIYSAYVNALKDQFINDKLTPAETSKIMLDIQQQARAIYGDLLANVSNELRCIARKYGFTPDELITFIVTESKKERISGIMTKLLKEEICYTFAKMSEIDTVIRTIEGIDGISIINCNVDTVEVRNGKILKFDIRTDLMDGKYTVTVNDNDTVTLSRPITEFIAIPEADNTKLTFGVSFKDKRTLATINGGDKVSLKLGKKSVKTNNGEKLYDALFLFNADGEIITEVYCGTFAAKDMVNKKAQFNILAPHYNGKSGIVSLMDMSEKREDGSYYAIITLSSVEKSSVPNTPTSNNGVRYSNRQSLDNALAAYGLA